jgi:pimeloyl-ACP methyl ester carboxylesterase
MKNIFISDWSFTKEYFPAISKKFTFFEPFVDNIDYVLGEVDNGGKTLIGWSAGAHIISKYIGTFGDKWEKIILIAPYMHFVESFFEENIDIIIKGLNKDFAKTVKYFQAKAGVIPIAQPSEKYLNNLIDGLNYLKSSKITEGSSAKNVLVIYGCADQLIKRRSILNFLNNFKNSEFTEIDQPHYIPEDVILKLTQKQLSDI